LQGERQQKKESDTSSKRREIQVAREKAQTHNIIWKGIQITGGRDTLTRGSEA
jgi:hypothetical protein